MGVIVKPHKKGGWLVEIRVRAPSGERIRERHRSPVSSRSASERWGEERARHLLIVGKSVPQEPEKEIKTLREFYKEFWKNHVEANRLKASTKLSIASIWRAHLDPKLGSSRLDEIGNREVQDMKAGLSSLSTKTVNNVLAVLSRILRAAVEWDVIPQTACRIKLVKVRSEEMESYESEAFEALVSSAKRIDSFAELVALLGGEAGLRSGEMLGLEWGDVDLRRRVLTIARAVYKGTTDSTKGNRIRRIEMTERLHSALSVHRHLRGDRVLCFENGSPATWWLLRKKLKAAQQLAGLAPTGKLHSLRHTFCSRLAMAGVPARTIQSLAGHVSLSTTEKYMHLSPRAGEGAIRALEALSAGHQLGTA